MFLKRLSIATGGAALVVAALAAGASAGTEDITHVSIGGDNTTDAWVNATGDNDGSINFLTDFAAAPVPMECLASAITGQIHQSAPVQAGSVLGHIDTLTFTNCVATDLDFPVIVELTDDADIDIVATASVPAHASVPIKITGIDAVMHSTGSKPWTCNVHAINRTGVDLTGSVVPGSGSVDGTIIISNANDALALTALDGTTDAPTSSGTCGGQIYTGDNANMGGSFTLDTAGLVDHS